MTIPVVHASRGRLNIGGPIVVMFIGVLVAWLLGNWWEFPGRFPLGLLILAAGVVWFITELKARNPRPQASDDVATDGRQSMVMLDPNDQA